MCVCVFVYRFMVKNVTQLCVTFEDSVCFSVCRTDLTHGTSSQRAGMCTAMGGTHMDSDQSQ